MNEKKNKVRMTNKKFLAIWTPVLAIVMAIMLIANVLIQYYSFTIKQVLGYGEMTVTKAEGSEDWDSDYNTADYDTAEEALAAAMDVTEEIAGEGITLLENKDNVLPLKASDGEKIKVTLLGNSSINPVYSGTGSGSASDENMTSLVDALNNNGFEVNQATVDLYNSDKVTSPTYDKTVKNVGMMGEEESGPFQKYARNTSGLYAENSPWIIGEVPVTDEFYTADIESTYKDYSDAAIVTFSRVSGEGADMPHDMGKFSDWGGEEGKHYLELDSTEKALLQYASDNFDTVIVIINSSNAMELGELSDGTYENVKGVLWTGGFGSTGTIALAKILKGEINPSGHLADIYASDFTQDPTYVNFGDYQYENVSSDNALGQSYFVQYEEGIYEGYRYYETADAEGFINYDEAVVYPFGYGLSYTTFEQKFASEPTVKDGKITFDVTVENTGDVAGKDVVELYYHAPYGDETTNTNKIEKAERVLGAFAKTKTLEPGESQTLTLTICIDDMASYDQNVEKAYVLDDGDYVITLMKNSHEAWGEGSEYSYTYTQDKKVVYDTENPRESDNVAATNQFDDVTAGMTSVMSRSDFAGTFPTAPEGDDFVASDDVINGLKEYDPKDHDNESDEMPVTNQDSGLQLIDMRGLDYDDPAWDSFIQELTVDELAAYVNGVGNASVERLGIPITSGIDGPAGLKSVYDVTNATANNAYTTEVVLASTWNVELAEKMGVAVGNEALFSGVSGWYAPGANTHRTPFSGRNFEYMSEDAVLSGKMLAAEISGTSSKGLYTYMKHFALNDQETNRNNYGGICVWADEQTIREVYLKAFEIPVKEATAELKYISDENGTVTTKEIKGSTAMMSSFNRIGTTWAGGSAALLQNVLRDEWGFEGVVCTDAIDGDFMNGDQAVRNGTDLLMTSTLPGSDRASYGGARTVETDSATAVKALQDSCKHILYTVANSSQMNGLVSGTTIKYSLATWQIALIVVDCVVGVLWVIGLIFVIRRVKKNKQVCA